MPTAGNTRPQCSDIEPEPGREVLADKAALRSGPHAAGLRERLERKGVLVFAPAHLTDEEQVAFTWPPGTMHRATPYPLDCSRMQHRTSLHGEEPVG